MTKLFSFVLPVLITLVIPSSNSFVTTTTRAVTTTSKITKRKSSEEIMAATTPTPTDFNGGKMAHIFKFDDVTHMYTSDWSSEEAQEALIRGRLFYKIDGSNGMLVRVDDDSDTSSSSSSSMKFRAYQRLDTKGKPFPNENCIALPSSDDGNYSNNGSSYVGHSYCYEPVLADVEGKKLKKRNLAMLAIVEKYTDHLLGLNRKFISIEWVGDKFQKTPGVPVDVAIAIHSEQVCDEIVERTYDGIKSFLLDVGGGGEEDRRQPIEGLLVEHNGTFWKVRADCFDRKCKFKTDPKTVRPPVYLAI